MIKTPQNIIKSNPVTLKSRAGCLVLLVAQTTLIKLAYLRK